MDTVLTIVNLLAQESPQSKIILINEEPGDELILDCLVKGVDGYLPVDTMEIFLKKAVKAVYSNQVSQARVIVD
jgi:DNA-binding NarL/FixJ family response regulator